MSAFFRIALARISAERIWFQSYLEGRVQRISVNGTLSNTFALECIDPQGSCLGPL